MVNTETDYDILREIDKSRVEKVAMETENEKAKNDFARELLEENPIMYDIPHAFARKKPLKLRMREKWQRIINKLKITFGAYDKQEF